jgi:hypothetical protein
MKTFQFLLKIYVADVCLLNNYVRMVQHGMLTYNEPFNAHAGLPRLWSDRSFNTCEASLFACDVPGLKQCVAHACEGTKSD